MNKTLKFSLYVVAICCSLSVVAIRYYDISDDEPVVPKKQNPELSLLKTQQKYCDSFMLEHDKFSKLRDAVIIPPAGYADRKYNQGLIDGMRKCADKMDFYNGKVKEIDSLINR